MRYVLAVAEYRSFSLAAQSCYVGQPALSQQIARLEKELGVTLFSRTTHGVSLTQAGEEFVLRAREILQRTDALTAEMANYAGLRKGTLNLGTITSLQCIDFGNLLSAFSSAYPNITLNIVEHGTYHLLRMLTERSIDAAILNRPQSHLPAGIELSQLGTDNYSIAVAANQRLAGKKTVCLSELRDEPFIFHQNGQVASELCMNACQNAGFTPRIVCRAANPSMGMYMVQGGLGVVFVPSEEFLTRKLAGIVELKLKEPITKTVGIAWRSDNASSIVDTVVDFAQKWVKDRK